ncbi:MAG: ABC transporter ATP-binding protein [Oleiphilaceae bacterium]|nr:ABC transporter ATP-binding protein [Oleiphilaceae bacterium]
MSEQTSPILQVNHLAVRFKQGGGVTDAVKQVSFDVHQGQTVALVGESGSGKSVTAQSIMRLLPEKLVTYPAGQILLDGVNVLQSTEQHMRQVRGRDIGMIFQEPMTSLNPLHTVEKQITESLNLHQQLDKKSARARTLELLEWVGIPQAEKRLGAYPHELSGGQKQRVMIAMALANQPRILIADEPTTALDVSVQRQVLELIERLQKETGMAVILISHDLNVVQRYADHVVVMRDGEMLESGPSSQLFHQPQHPYTRTLIEAEPKGSPEPVAQDSPSLLTAQDIRVEFALQKNLFGKVVDQLVALDNVDLTLRRGETLGIVGESGSGKTTLGLALCKLLGAKGQINYAGQDVATFTQKQFRPYRRRIQFVFQDPYGSLSPRMSVAQIIQEGLNIHFPEDKAEHAKRIADVLTEVGLDPSVQHRYPHEFSGGQRQRIAIARALVLKPEIVVLDEPTSALDRTVQIQIIELLRSLQQKYQLSYIFISHDLAVVRALSHRIMVLHHGKVVEQNHCSALFEAPEHSYTKKLLEAAFFYSQQNPEQC